MTSSKSPILFFIVGDEFFFPIIPAEVNLRIDFAVVGREAREYSILVVGAGLYVRV